MNTRSEGEIVFARWGSLISSLTFALLTFIGLAVTPAQAQDYDLVILNGRVMDPETNLDAVRNVGVKDSKIVTITEGAIAGAESIDARGHVVAPGFIDPHVHGIELSGFTSKVMLRDGVTTQLELEVDSRSKSLA